MGRARQSANAAVAADRRFDSVLGVGRGRLDLDRLDADHPSPSARDELERLTRGLDAGHFDEALGVLASCDNSRPLIAQLAERTAEAGARRILEAWSGAPLRKALNELGTRPLMSSRLFASEGMMHVSDQVLLGGIGPGAYIAGLCGTAFEGGQFNMCRRGTWAAKNMQRCAACEAAVARSTDTDMAADVNEYPVAEEGLGYPVCPAIGTTGENLITIKAGRRIRRALSAEQPRTFEALRFAGEWDVRDELAEHLVGRALTQERANLWRALDSHGDGFLATEARAEGALDGKLGWRRWRAVVDGMLDALENGVDGEAAGTRAAEALASEFDKLAAPSAA